jgi:hypothetical protein
MWAKQRDACHLAEGSLDERIATPSDEETEGEQG